MTTRSPRRPGRLASARARRLAVYGLMAVLVLWSTAALVSSRQQDGLTRVAADAAAAADHYEQARYLAAVQHAGHQEALDAPTNEAIRLAHRSAAMDFLTLMTVLRAHDAANRTTLDLIIAEQGRYLTLTDGFFALTGSGRVAEAAAFQERAIAPVERAMLARVTELAGRHRAASVAAHAELRRHTRVLLWGTPATLAVGLGLLLLFTLITRAYRRTVENQAAFDPLTGLPNRAQFQDRCAQALTAARRGAPRPAVLLLDLNDFKQINDTLGHHLGDELLTRVAGRLAEVVRGRDIVARLGGDEFAILLAEGDDEIGEKVADRVAEALRRPFVLDGVTLDVEASVGIATAAHGEDVLTVVRHADTAMYVAKRHRLGYAHYEPEQDHNTLARLTLLGDLRRALHDGEFVLHYQPKVAMDSGEVIGVEALARWQHPERGLLQPDEFISALDATSLGQQFTLQVIGEALIHTKGWFERGRRLPVAVNISTRSLLDQRFPEAVAELLARTAVPPDLLCLEITESTIMADPELALDVLNRVRAMGVKTAIDDFGTGYSSMAYLKLLPLDELKIDRSFVTDMTVDPKNTMLVQSAIDLGHNLGLAVVAEGIEDRPTYAALHELGCDVAQGFLFARPLPADALADMIEAHTAVS